MQGYSCADYCGRHLDTSSSLPLFSVMKSLYSGKQIIMALILIQFIDSTQSIVSQTNTNTLNYIQKSMHSQLFLVTFLNILFASRRMRKGQFVIISRPCLRDRERHQCAVCGRDRGSGFGFGFWFGGVEPGADPAPGGPECSGPPGVVRGFSGRRASGSGRLSDRGPSDTVFFGPQSIRIRLRSGVFQGAGLRIRCFSGRGPSRK